MAKTAYTIYLDYQKALRQAEKLEQAAKDIQKEVSELQSCQGRISAAWKGDNANKFIHKMKKVESDLTKVANNYSKTAATIRKIAGNTYQAEQRALELAQKRNV